MSDKICQACGEPANHYADEGDGTITCLTCVFDQRNEAAQEANTYRKELEALRGVRTKFESVKKERDFLLQYIEVDDVGDEDPCPGVCIDESGLDTALHTYFKVGWRKDGILPVIRRAIHNRDAGNNDQA